MSRRSIAIVLALTAFVSYDARAQTDTRLRTTIEAALAESQLAQGASIAVVDTGTKQTLFSHQPDLVRNPASNMKLITAAAALAQLGPEFRMRTALLGRIEGDTVPVLALRGYGDPSLRQADLIELARDLAHRGVRRVGEVVVDGTYFDTRTLPPAFEQQPDEIAPFRAAIGAISVDANAYSLRVLPGAGASAPARIQLDGAGYFNLESTVITGDPSAAPSVIAVQRDAGERMQLTLRGSVPLGSPTLSYRRRIEHPLYWAGHLMRDALAAAGIRSGEVIRLAATPSEGAVLAQHLSRPLSELVSAMGKQSDNFVAEMVFRVLGAELHHPGSSEDAVRALREALREAHLSDSWVVVNGSGLFDGNLVSAADMTKVLLFAHENPATRAEYLAHLAIGGVDGTLDRRLTDLPRPRIVRAKTGTLDDAIALSGYVLGPNARTIAFSVLVNGARGKTGSARVLCDAVARAIAQELWR